MNVRTKNAFQLIREARGKSRVECAEALGLNPKTWKRWELGQNKPRIEHLFAAARYLGVPVGELNDFPPVTERPGSDPDRPRDRR